MVRRLFQPMSPDLEIKSRNESNVRKRMQKKRYVSRILRVQYGMRGPSSRADDSYESSATQHRGGVMPLIIIFDRLRRQVYESMHLTHVRGEHDPPFCDRRVPRETLGPIH